MNDIKKFAGKIAILILPFVLVLALFLANAQSPVTLKEHLMHEKIQRLIVAATSSVRVIIAGESRAEQGLAPEVFTEKTGLSAANIAVADGGFSEEYDALKDMQVLGHQRIIIIGISSYEMNDRMLIFLQPLDSAVIAKEPWSWDKFSDAASFANSRLLYYIQQFKSFYRGTMQETGHMDDLTFAHKGWRYSTGVYVPGQNNEPNKWQIEFDAIKKDDFARAVAGFASSTDVVVLFTGPVAPTAKREASYESTIDLEKDFVEHVDRLIAPYPNIHFIDFRTKDIAELSDKEFDDAEHLNADGARIFTSILIQALKERHVLK